METKISDERLYDIMSYDQVFFKFYLRDYFKRLLNQDNGIIFDAFLRFNNKRDLDLDPRDIIDLGDRINFSKKVFGFRTFDYDDKIYVPNHDFLYNRIYTLLNAYANLWSDISVLEKEAYLHIQLMRIIPFSLNNELICFLILVSNLMNSYIPPFILEDEDKELYYEYIKIGDAGSFRNIIKKRSLEELNRMIKLYKEFYQLPMEKDIREILIQKV